MKSLIWYFLGLTTALVAPPRYQTPLSSHDISNGQQCGKEHNDQRCETGWCCSKAGMCGTGPSFCSGPECQIDYCDQCHAQVRPNPWIDTAHMPRPHFGSIAYGLNINSCDQPGMVALTFDDGPSPYTEKLLDMLKEADMRATFFLTGKNEGKQSFGDPESEYHRLVQRMIIEGHQVGQHTWTHQDLDRITTDQRFQQIQYNEAALASVLGVIPTYMRPPYLECTAACLADLAHLGYHVVRIDLDTLDWMQNLTMSKEYISSALEGKASNTHSHLLLAHDVLPDTVDTLVPYMIEMAKREGYRSVTVGECLGDPPQNWYRDLETGAPRSPWIEGYSQMAVDLAVPSEAAYEQPLLASNFELELHE